ncbi:MAG: hypothetical protein WA705_03220 [Candidatus Ozemobacteraceae bacterium]
MMAKTFSKKTAIPRILPPARMNGTNISMVEQIGARLGKGFPPEKQDFKPHAPKRNIPRRRKMAPRNLVMASEAVPLNERLPLLMSKIFITPVVEV